MKKSKTASSIFLVFSILVFYFLLPFQADNGFMEQSAYADEDRDKTLKERREGYFSDYTSVFKTNNNIRILLVAGHDDEYHGTEHQGVREVDLNREVVSYLYETLRKEPGFSVARVSDENGYTRTFQKFFDKHEKDIKDFVEKAEKKFNKKIKRGEIDFEETNFHNHAPGEMVTRLYGINLWANESEFDLTLHVHFNDYAGRYKDEKPKHNGFSIYIPEEQFKNHEISKEFAENIFNRLSKYFPVSTLKQEREGVVESQELIAIGSKETLEAASLLVEYGYIYEPQFTHPDTRSVVLKDLAEQTYLGLKDYFRESVYSFDRQTYKNDLYFDDKKRDEEIYFLQKELLEKGFFPPKNKTLNECPLTGLFGECTKNAVKEFQKSKSIKSTGYVGELTRAELNKI
jgi:N-acetylmuramoyl-L-alanine amidase